jgi:hypothetical protein
VESTFKIKFMKEEGRLFGKRKGTSKRGERDRRG